MATISATGFVTQPPVSLGDELPSTSQSTLLLQKKKEMAEVQQQLDQKKEEFRQRMQQCQEKEVELAAKQEAIKDQVRKFDKFLKDNDAKRVRAHRKAQEEVKLREQKETEKQALARELEKQLEKRTELQKELRRKAVYEQFLELVCDSTEYFEDIENVLKRYETLEAAQIDLRSRVDHAQTQAEEQSAALAALVKKTQTESLVFNSQIASHQKALDSMRLEAQDKESDLSRRESDAKEGFRQLGEITMAIHNIYSRCRARGESTHPNENRQAMLLDVVKRRIMDLQDIVSTHERHERSKPSTTPMSASMPSHHSEGPIVGRVVREPRGSLHLVGDSASRVQSGSMMGAGSASASRTADGSSGRAVGGSVSRISTAGCSDGQKTLPRLS